MSAAPLVAFLDRTDRLVPLGQERTLGDFEGNLEEELGRILAEEKAPAETRVRTGPTGTYRPGPSACHPIRMSPRPCVTPALCRSGRTSVCHPDRPAVPGAVSALPPWPPGRAGYLLRRRPPPPSPRAGVFCVDDAEAVSGSADLGPGAGPPCPALRPPPAAPCPVFPGPAVCGPGDGKAGVRLPGAGRSAETTSAASAVVTGTEATRPIEPTSVRTISSATSSLLATVPMLTARSRRAAAAAARRPRRRGREC